MRAKLPLTLEAGKHANSPLLVVRELPGEQRPKMETIWFVEYLLQRMQDERTP